ncbi:pyridoxamine 5'-phosphate oxidase family protein [Maribacter halichondriae]|uniref:pyridoxamine 5'-phosphate oxidase family protein n=1 Tax=Maribacter halichondriae TaxID=2980554 RepID=UPI0023589FD6|nr:pyridoxamine 5'-phosphate oxidase family protein [Maribacter sp. Hal144]
MRRKLDTKECIAILSNNYIAQLAYLTGASPYVLPITYYYDSDTHTITSYSSKGHKVKAMRKNPAVALSVNEIKSVQDWRSVMVHGTYEELDGINAKHMLHEFSEGVKKIINRNAEKEVHFISDFSSKIYTDDNPIIYRIKIGEITGKLRKS